MALANSYIGLNYFSGGITIPNISSTDVVEQVEYAINRYESQFLTDLLGYKFYDLVKSNTNWSNVPLDGTSSIYTNIIQGTSYNRNDGYRVITEGLTGDIIYNANSGFYRSPIANYVYYQYMRENQSQTSNVGEVYLQSENSIRVSSNNKMVTAWNEMVDLLWVLHDFIMDNEAKYPDYIGFEYEPIWNPRNFTYLMPNQKLFVKINPLGL